MGRPRSVVLVVGVVVVIALAAVALVATRTAAPPAPEAVCLERSTRLSTAPRTAGGVGVCLQYGEAPDRADSLFDDRSAPYWWFAVGAVLVLTAVGLAVAPGRRATPTA